MKKLILIALAALLSLSGNSLFAQNEEANNNSGQINFPKSDISPMDEAIYRNPDEKVMARVIYSRPQKKDREIFGKLVPYGQVWRTGANEATELTLYQDMSIAGKTVKAGTYTVYTIPEQHEWTVILNSKTNTWGAFDYSEKEDVVRVKVPVKTAPTSIESFSMAFVPNDNGAKLLMGWDNKYVEVPFKATM
ncbi:MAG: DUF2911 domain-containing protein [Gillisia sp.]